MQPARRPSSSEPSIAAFAGLETGVLGGLVILAWYALSSVARGEAAWTVPADLAALLYRWPSLEGRLTLAAASGAAIEIVGAGASGILFGSIARGVRSHRRVLLLGVLFGLGWHYALQAILARHSTAADYLFSQRPVIAGHLLFGLWLGMFTRLFDRIRAGFPPSK